MFLGVALVLGFSFAPLPARAQAEDPVYQSALRDIQNKRYGRAREKLFALRSACPPADCSACFPDTTFSIAESYYADPQDKPGQRQADFWYREFLEKYGLSDPARAAEARFKIGFLHYRYRELNPDRDLRHARIAEEEFLILFRDHPDSPFAARAQGPFREIRQVLARHEWNVARFYLKKKNYKAARSRLETLVKEYSDFTGLDGALRELRGLADPSGK